jgi:hypothetical protein
MKVYYLPESVSCRQCAQQIAASGCESWLQKQQLFIPAASGLLQLRASYHWAARSKGSFRLLKNAVLITPLMACAGTSLAIAAVLCLIFAAVDHAAAAAAA